MTKRRVELGLSCDGARDPDTFEATISCAECGTILMLVARGFSDSFFPVHLDDIECDCETHGGCRPVVDLDDTDGLSQEAAWRRENNA